jgi:hypothetical protein
MQVERYITQVQTQLAAAAALGDDRTRETGAALATAAEPAVRLAVLAAASSLADEVTAALLDAPAAPSVAVHLDGDDVRVEVRVSEPGDAADNPAPGSPDDAENTARISLRLPEALKVQIETAARDEGVSVNTWIVRAASSVLSAGGWNSKRSSGRSRRVTGWINS